jgi:cell pole-organizing protein PopZ
MRHASEPSVEEILESIKKVIARDNRAEAAQVRRMRESEAQPQVEPDRDEADSFADALADSLSEDDIFDLGSDAELLDELEIEEAPLVTEDARMSMQDSLTALSMLAEPGARPQIVRSGETSLEGLVRELLRPALADWLEQNLPGIVERLVAAEIARIAGKRG